MVIEFESRYRTHRPNQAGGAVAEVEKGSFRKHNAGEAPSSRAIGAMRLPLLLRAGAPTPVRLLEGPCRLHVSEPRQSLYYPSISSISSNTRFGPRTYSTSSHHRPRPSLQTATRRGIQLQPTLPTCSHHQIAKMSSQAAHPALMIPGPIEFDDAVLQSMAHYRYVLRPRMRGPRASGEWPEQHCLQVAVLNTLLTAVPVF